MDSSLLNLKYWLFVVTPERDDESIGIYHACGYERFPETNEIAESWKTDLMEEVRNDKEFGLGDMIEQLDLRCIEIPYETAIYLLKQIYPE